VEVPDPFKKMDGRPALVPGMFVEVIIQGKSLEQVIPIERSSIHQGNEVWVIQKDSHLRIYTVEIARQDQDYAYVISGLEDGALIVTSPLDTVTDGMTVRTERK
jgi:hypothetical protein